MDLAGILRTVRKVFKSTDDIISILDTQPNDLDTRVSLLEKQIKTLAQHVQGRDKEHDERLTYLEQSNPSVTFPVESLSEPVEEILSKIATKKQTKKR